ncbi:aminoacyl-tRNA hydrolase [Corynebacterium aquatimens]|nr:aminoacyl-tRNA hydrolase [Corynebacterium aquatimens]WJY66256.1 Peptidyl-tRNA hydrolase [Corynebacterium aquatimens]
MFASVFDRLRALFARPESEDSSVRSAATPNQKAQPRDLSGVEWLVIGLGNPGAKYEATRHNIGYLAIDELLERHSLTLGAVPGHKAQVAVKDNVAYVRSTTYMNESGEAVGPLARELGITPERIIALHDELDLAPYKIRCKLGGNENGHNGLKSITQHLGTRDYVRIKIAIGRPPKGTPIIDWVLGTFSEDEAGPALDGQVSSAADTVELITSEANPAAGLTRAQNDIHAR